MIDSTNVQCENTEKKKYNSQLFPICVQYINIMNYRKIFFFKKKSTRLHF